MGPKGISIAVLGSLTAVICCTSASDFGWNRSVETIPLSYCNVSTANVLRCGNLCERQGKCKAVTFDVRERKCYMHDISIDAKQTVTGSSGRYLIKNYPDQSKPDAATQTCDKDTQISVPTIHHKYGGCYDIIERNECSSSPCQNNAACEAKKNDYKCNCEAEYSGKDCSVAPCPADKGYKLWTYSDMNLCIRYDLTTVDGQQGAQNQCKADGGHLVVITNDSMRLHLVEIATNLTMNGWTYLDGRRSINGTDVFIDWKGEEAWLSWSPGSPVSHNCLDTRLSENFHHFNWFCSYQLQYLLCQIFV